MRHLTRVEALAWWKEAPTANAAARDTLDYVQAWTDQGAAWVTIDRKTGAMHVRGWFD